jgi:hypothetical protein
MSGGFAVPGENPINYKPMVLRYETTSIIAAIAFVLIAV